MTGIKRRLLILFSLVCISFCGCSSKDIEMTKESKKYLSAVEEMVNFYELNPYMFANCEEKKWKNSLTKLKEDIRNNRVDEDEIYFRMQELSASLNNGHTHCEKTDKKDERFFPIKGIYCGDKYYIIFADEKYKELLGAEVISINGVSFKDVEKKVSKLISAENNQIIKSSMEERLASESLFKYLDIWKEDNRFKIKKLDGTVENVSIKTVTKDQCYQSMSDTNNYFNYDKQRECMGYNKPDDAYDQYWYTVDSKNRILYFRYNTCFDKNDGKYAGSSVDISTYPDFNEFQKKFTEYANSNFNNYDKIVVDVSCNMGGVKEHFDNLINENLSLFNSKKVYTIMTKNTFSAGVGVVDTLVEKCNATMVGEETGGSIQIYGVNFKKSSILPIVYYSGSYPLSFSNAGKNSKNDMRGAIPDIEVEITIDDIVNAVNPYYQAVIDN